MDRSWLNYQYGPDYLRGVEDFINQASRYVDKKQRTKCPCKKCKNTEYWHINVVKQHLFDHGMQKNYTQWVYHGEPEVLSSDDEDDEDNEGIEGSRQGLEEFLEDLRVARENLEHGVRHNQFVDNHITDLAQSAPNTCDDTDDTFDKLLREARQPLYPGCKTFTKLDFLVKLLHLKVINHCSIKTFEGHLKLIKAALPEGETLPNSYYEAKMLIRRLGLGYIPIHACKHDCVLFWKEYETLQNCPICGEPRYKHITHKGKMIPQKVLRYFPLKPRLQRLYMSRMTATDMRWHKEKRTVEENVFKHPADSYAWKEFDKEYGWFANDPRNVRLGLATDGFNPFGNMSNAYSMWPVMVVPYNMPPWKCMKDPFIFMSLLIPRPTAPGNDIDVYLRPLIDELAELWEDGVETFDAMAKETFRLHAAVLWTINDFPAYANLSGWSTKGKLACPVCNAETTSTYLKHSRKLCYMNHIRFLQARHPLRKRAKKLFGHLKWSKSRPKDLSGDDLLSQLDYVEELNFGKNPTSKKRKRVDVELNWKKRSIFFDLPYWRMLKLRHNLDVMHIEKNICENVLGTIMKMEGKTKDTIKSRLDLEVLGIRSELHLKTKPGLGNKLLMPHACYSLSPIEKMGICEWLKIVKFPDGYASNISRCVNLKDRKISGLKSHDCHVLLQRLLPENSPSGFRSYIDELLANSHHMLGSHLVKTGISKETKRGGLRSESSKSMTTSQNVDGSHSVKTNISKETKSGGLRSEGSNSITMSQNVDGSYLVKTNISKETKSGGPKSITMSQRVDGSHSVKTNISKETKSGGFRSEGPKSITMSQHVVGSHTLNTVTSNESNLAIAPGGVPSHVNQVLRKSPRKHGSQRMSDPQHAMGFHRVPNSLKRSHHPSDSQRVTDSQIVDSQIAATSQPASVNTTSDTNAESMEVHTKERKGRKKAQNKALNDFIDGGGGKPKIEIPIGKKRPLGKWSHEWVSEIGIIVVQNIPLTFHYWKELKDEHKAPLYKKIQLKFDVDMSLEHVREAVDSSLKDRFKDRRHKIHLYYLSIPEGVNKLDHPEKTVTQLEWESLCNHFESEKFKRSCERNKNNRARPRVNHRGGRKSFVCHRFDQRDEETGEEPGVVDFYRNMRWNEKKGWTAPQAEENYEKMLEIRSQRSDEDGVITDTQILEKVLGKRSGYVMGLGHGEVPPSRKYRVAHNEVELNQLRQRTEEQDQELNELRAWKDLQEEQSKAQQKMIEAQQQLIEEQARKQEEAAILLNALKQKCGL